jgi:hypothetical protein
MMKFLLTLVIVIFIWRIFQWLQQPNHVRQVPPDRTGRPRAIDTVACTRCGTYVPSVRPTACDRADCPFPRRAQG